MPVVFSTKSSVTDQLPHGNYTKRFHNDERPSPLPTDPFFKLESTTIHVEEQSPQKIWNCLIGFLSNGIISNVLKISPQKFAIKSEFFMNSLFCVIKIRIYDTGPHAHAIEFQRRSGDSICFIQVFRKAVACLSAPLNLERRERMPLQLKDCPNPDIVIEKDDLDPILDMAFTEQSHLQAEAARVLNVLAKENPLILLSSRSFAALYKLLENSATSVAYPAISIFRYLSLLPESAELFSEAELINLILEKAISSTTTKTLQNWSIEALQNIIAKHSPSTLGEREAVVLQKRLTELGTSASTLDTKTKDELLFCQMLLMSKFPQLRLRSKI